MTEPAALLRERIADRTAIIGIAGLGYVGLPTALAYAEAGFHVVGVDVDARRCADINSGKSHTKDISDEALRRQVNSGQLKAVESFEAAGDLDVVDICVPTPLDKSREPDVSAIVSAVKAACVRLREGQLMVLTSTTYPGTTVELVRPLLETGGLVVGSQIFLAFAPERIDPGNPRYHLHNTPKIVGGVTAACTELAAQLFGTIVETVVPVSSATTAEVTKLLENTFRSINIGLANEMAIMCRRLGVDVWEVIDSAATKPYGFMAFYPGPGLGGHCIPIDPSYLAWKLRQMNYRARFIDLADEMNRGMPEYVVSRITEVLNEQALSVKGAKILILGVAYKPDVSDLRESPALDIMTLLSERGAVLSWADPLVESLPLETGLEIARSDLTASLLANQDIAVITTDHRAFDWELIRENCRLVLDTRGKRRDYRGNGWHTL